MTIGGLFSALFIGLIVGALGRLVLPGRQRIPIWLTMLVGFLAALIGTAVARALFGADAVDTGGIDWIELGVQVALAAVGVGVVGALRGRS